MKKTESGLPVLNREELKKFIQKWNYSDTKKGILLLGPVGVGKTTLVKECKKKLHTGDYRGLMFNSIHDIVINYMKDGINSISFTYEIIDDIGTEQIPNNYGTKLDVFELIIQQMYNKNFERLCLTSNLSVKELQERYGERVVSRLNQMCHVIVLDDTNLRNTNHYEDTLNLFDSDYDVKYLEKVKEEQEIKKSSLIEDDIEHYLN